MDDRYITVSFSIEAEIVWHRVQKRTAILPEVTNAALAMP